MDKQELIDFEKWCKQTYLDGKLRSPLHLSGGNEEELIAIFKHIKPNDWVFTTYRSHYHALLKGVDPEWLKQWILDNKSIHVMSKEHKIITSAIVGGTLPQAVGCAMAIKRRNGKEKVWAFCGDMTASLGVFQDCHVYAIDNYLPITFVIEDNGLSTDTPTGEAWGCGVEEMDLWFQQLKELPKIKYYKYKRVYPHYGVGKFVAF